MAAKMLTGWNTDKSAKDLQEPLGFQDGRIICSCCLWTTTKGGGGGGGGGGTIMGLNDLLFLVSFHEHSRLVARLGKFEIT